MRQSDDGFAFVTITNGGCGGGVARLGIEQDGLDDRFHVAADTLSVIGEDVGDSLDVTGRRITGDEALDELAGNERSDVRMIEQYVERLGQIRCLSLARHCRCPI